MSRRGYLWAVIFIATACASFFSKKSDLEKGITLFNKKEISRAVQYFDRYYQKYPSSDTALYFLYNCYRYLNDPEMELQTLERLVALDVTDPNVFLNTYYHYQAGKRYRDMFVLLANVKPPISPVFDQRFPLTRRKMAELLCGATSRKLYSEPMIFALSEDLLPVFPDRNLYPDDTLSMAQLIILLDLFLKPDPPGNLYTVNGIPSTSFLYLPYMRLVNKGILDFSPDIVPSNRAILTIAARAIKKIKDRGLIE